MIQASARGKSDRKAFEDARSASVRIQAAWRGTMGRTAVLEAATLLRTQGGASYLRGGTWIDPLLHEIDIGKMSASSLRGKLTPCPGLDGDSRETAAFPQQEADTREKRSILSATFPSTGGCLNWTG